VFPSLWEGFGFPALEAMACGTPVITSDLASLPEVTGDAAILVDPYSVEAIAQAMDVIDRDPSLCAELRQRGLVRSQQFSWEKTGLMTVEVLDRYL
jgi:glycosyltransferase involved in cell wall biosynthesis